MLSWHGQWSQTEDHMMHISCPWRFQKLSRQGKISTKTFGILRRKLYGLNPVGIIPAELPALMTRYVPFLQLRYVLRKADWTGWKCRLNLMLSICLSCRGVRRQEECSSSFPSPPLRLIENHIQAVTPQINASNAQTQSSKYYSSLRTKAVSLPGTPRSTNLE